MINKLKALLQLLNGKKYQTTIEVRQSPTYSDWEVTKNGNDFNVRFPK